MGPGSSLPAAPRSPRRRPGGPPRAAAPRFPGWPRRTWPPASAPRCGAGSATPGPQRSPSRWVRSGARVLGVGVASSGIVVAAVASLPAASRIGTLSTWGAAFAVAAVFAAVAAAAELAGVPRLGAGGRVRPGSLLTVVTLPVSRIGLVAAGAIFFANFAAYTYIGPLLHTRAGLGAGAITLVLLGFGLAGAAGNFTAGVTVRSHLRATLMGSGLLIASSALLLATLTGARPLTIALVALSRLDINAR